MLLLQRTRGSIPRTHMDDFQNLPGGSQPPITPFAGDPTGTHMVYIHAYRKSIKVMDLLESLKECILSVIYVNFLLSKYLKR